MRSLALRRPGTALATHGRVGDEGNISGDALVEALLRAGFRIRSRTNGIAILVRNGNVVMVPDLDVVEPAMLRAIVRSSGLTRD